MKLQFESLNSSYNYSEFDCGNEALNQFLIKRAKIEERNAYQGQEVRKK